MDPRESSHSRHDDGYAVDVVIHPQPSHADAPPTELAVDTDSTVQRPDVASLVSAPVPDESAGQPSRDVAGLVQSELARDPESTLEEVKNLVPSDSPEVGLTGAVQFESEAARTVDPARRRRLFPNVHCAPRATAAPSDSAAYLRLLPLPRLHLPVARDHVLIRRLLASAGHRRLAHPTKSPPPPSGRASRSGWTLCPYCSSARSAAFSLTTSTAESSWPSYTATRPRSR